MNRIEFPCVLPFVGGPKNGRIVNCEGPVVVIPELRGFQNHKGEWHCVPGGIEYSLHFYRTESGKSVPCMVLRGQEEDIGDLVDQLLTAALMFGDKE